MLNFVIDSIPYLIGLVFLVSIVLGYKDAKKWKRIDDLNRIYYNGIDISKPPKNQ